MIEQLPDVELPRPAPAADAGPLDDAPLRPRRDARPAAPRRQPDRWRRSSASTPRTTASATRAATPCSARSPPTGRTSRRSRRSTRPASRRRRGSSATSSCTTSASACSTATRSGAGSAGPPRPASSATRVFLLFARGAAPLAERIERIADRLAEAPAFLERSKTRAAGPQVAVWQRTEARYAARPARRCSREVRAAADGVLDGAALARLDRAIAGANAALEAYGAWVTGTLADATDDWPLGARALRRAGPAAGVRGPRRRRDPRDRTRAAAGEPRGAAGGGARDRPRRRPAERHRPGQVRRTRPRSTRRSRATATSCAGPAPT